MEVKSIISQFKKKKIAVVGDVMLDRYIYGHVDRISPEAPIPIVDWRETMIVPGGAGNTAANITALGAQCTLFGIIGDDSEGEELLATLATFGINTSGLITDNRPTTEKTRILGNGQQVVRIDHEQRRPLTDEKRQELCHRLETELQDCHAILVCDYAKGVIDNEVMDCLRSIAKDQTIPLLADVRPEHKDFYHNVSFITPNKKETAGMAGEAIRTLDDAKALGLQLAKALKSNVLVTMSEDGMLVIDYLTGQTTHLPTKAQEVTDVSGAGDTVIATLTLSLASHADHVTAATIANHAASVVVAKLGTATLSQEELLETFA